jgi:hypothetical protein
VLLDTKIVLRDTVFAKFHLVITTSSGNYTIFGDIYGLNLKRADSQTSITTSITNSNGFVRLEIGPFTSTGGEYTLTGTVQLC